MKEFYATTRSCDNLKAKGMHTPYEDTEIYSLLESSNPLNFFGCAARHLCFLGGLSRISKNKCTCAHPHMYREFT